MLLLSLILQYSIFLLSCYVSTYLKSTNARVSFEGRKKHHKQQEAVAINNNTTTTTTTTPFQVNHISNNNNNTVVDNDQDEGDGVQEVMDDQVKDDVKKMSASFQGNQK